MARGPQHTRRNEWIHFFLGSPPRFFWTALGLFVLFAALAPNAAAIAMSNIMNAFILAFGPTLGILLQIAIAVWAIWFFFIQPFVPKKKKKKDSH
jgi:H+/gluconate symporter-like permease